MRRSDRKAIISLAASLVAGWLVYGFSALFFAATMGSVAGPQLSGLVSLFYAATAGGMVFAGILFFWKDEDRKKEGKRPARVKRFKL